MAKINTWECQSCGHKVELSETAINQVGDIKRVVEDQNEGEICCDNMEYKLIE